MNLFDLHCDTAFALYKKNQSLLCGDCAISLEKTAGYETYAQVMAIWSQHSISAEAQWTQYHAILDNLRAEADKNADAVALCRTSKEFLAAKESGKRPLILGVEGGDPIAARIWRFDEMIDAGVRVLTLTWKDENCIGGSHNTNKPLTAFGRRLVPYAMRRGVTVDVSHASREVIADCLAIAREEGKPIIASHSDSYAVCEVPRNLTDEEAKGIAAVGGIIGVSLCPVHLTAHGQADVSDVIRHIRHYAELGLSDSVCLGCDLDGTDLPAGFESVADLPKIADALTGAGFTDEQIDHFFYGNAERFFLAHLG